MAESRKAINSKPRLLNHPFITHGLVPFAIAATVLVGVGITMFLPNDSSDLAIERPAEKGVLQFRGAAESISDIPSPEEWITHIRQLRDEGNLEKARIELREFLSKYDDYPIDDLKQLLEK